MDPDAWMITCPYCFQALETWIDPGTEGTFVQDCEVCCRPWQVWVERDEDGALVRVDVDRAQ